MTTTGLHLLMKRWRKRIRALVRPQQVDRELDEEFAFHIENEAARNRDAGMSPAESLRLARVAFGGVPKYHGAARDARWLSRFPDLTLDFRIGGRMLFKYPVITLVGGFAMAFAIFTGAVTFEMVTMFTHPTLPFAGGDRVVQIRNWDTQASRAEPHVFHDYMTWRIALTSVTELGAYRDVTRNLIATPGDARPVQVAEISASAFHIVPVQPLLGRTLLESDALPGAPPVIVIGANVWHNRFASSLAVIGKSVQVGDSYATIVGVMPEGFAFPVSHELWAPLRESTFSQAAREGPEISIFGRLAPGATFAGAAAELAALGRRTSLESPRTHEHLTPQIAPYAAGFDKVAGENEAVFLSIPGFAVILLVLICANVALLLFARAATREHEMLLRSALGASRARIVTQLVAEALVLVTVAAIAGLGAADFVLHRWGLSYLHGTLGQIPFWFVPHLSGATVLYAVGLTALGAAVAGVVPGLKVTRGMSQRLRQSAAGGGGLKFGGIWTGVIITQVAFTAAFPVVGFIEQRELRQVESFSPGFPAEQYLSARFDFDANTNGTDNGSEGIVRASEARFSLALAELQRRTALEPSVSGVTFVDRLPREGHVERLVEVEDASRNNGQRLASDTAIEASTATVDPSYFNVLGAPMLAGRNFHSGDIVGGARVVIVDQGFVRAILHGQNAIGQRMRFVGTPARGRDTSSAVPPWYTIVGVVKELGMKAATQHGFPSGVYFAGAPSSNGAATMIMHVRGDPMTFAPRLRELAAMVDPTMRLSEFQRVDQVISGPVWFIKLWLRMTVLLTAIALLLSLAGIYAVMSFTVSRRTREIGIRVALGASARSVVGSIFRRPLTQVSIGVAAGAVLSAVMLIATTGGRITATGTILLFAYAVIILGVCLLACVTPTRRALSVQPVEALRAE